MSNLPKQPWNHRSDDAMKIIDADGNGVAMVMQTHLYGRRAYEEAAAIRDLLAAAPDLLAACRAMHDSACTNASCTPSREAFVQVRAAIAKATEIQP